jgi:hypothetical protein
VVDKEIYGNTACNNKLEQSSLQVPAPIPKQAHGADAVREAVQVIDGSGEAQCRMCASSQCPCLHEYASFSGKKNKANTFWRKRIVVGTDVAIARSIYFLEKFQEKIVAFFVIRHLYTFVVSYCTTQR